MYLYIYLHVGQLTQTHTQPHTHIRVCRCSWKTIMSVKYPQTQHFTTNKILGQTGKWCRITVNYKIKYHFDEWWMCGFFKTSSAHSVIQILNQVMTISVHAPKITLVHRTASRLCAPIASTQFHLYAQTPLVSSELQWFARFSHNSCCC